MNKEIILAIGPLSIKVSGSSMYLNTFSKELRPALDSKNETADIEIAFDSNANNAFYKPTNFCGKNTIDFNESGFSVNGNPYYSYQMVNAFSDGPISVKVQVKHPSFVHKLLRLLKVASSVEYSSNISFLRGELANYSFLWNLITLALLKKKCAFIHSGVLDKNGNALVLSGTGGCGKTSTVLNLLRTEGMGYLAEDYGIVGADGFAYPSTKTISLYHSDVVRSGGSGQEVVQNLTFLKRVRWEILTKLMKRNPIIKAKPEELIGKDISNEPVKIGYGVYLSRQECGAVSISKISLEEFSKRSALASIREMKALTEILKLIEANSPNHFELLNGESLFKMVYEVYLSAFSHSDVFLMSVPIKAGPVEITNALNKVIEFH